MDELLTGKTDPKEKTILIVEDDDSLRTLFKMLLEAEGFKIEDVPSAEDALKCIEAHMPDLIILDFMLPGKGGYETLKDLQQEGAGSVPVVVCTARRLDSQMIKEIMNEPNVKEFCSKPIKHTVFISKIHSILNTRAAISATPKRGPLSSSW